MGLTRNVKETVRARMERDPGFRQALLEEGIERLLAGEVDLGKAVLRDYINSTIGFQELGDLTAKSPKSLMRMLGPAGNPQARHLSPGESLLPGAAPECAEDLLRPDDGHSEHHPRR